MGQGVAQGMGDSGWLTLGRGVMARGLWVTSVVAQEDVDGVGRGSEEVPNRGLDGMTHDQSMAIGSREYRPHLLKPTTTTL